MATDKLKERLRHGTALHSKIVAAVDARYALSHGELSDFHEQLKKDDDQLIFLHGLNLP